MGKSEGRIEGGEGFFEAEGFLSYYFGNFLLLESCWRTIN